MSRPASRLLLTARPGTRWRLAASVAVLWGLCALMQVVGLLHGYAHPARGSAQGPDVDRAALDRADRSEWRALFDGHSDGSDECRLVDQLVHADALIPALDTVQTLPVEPPRQAVHLAWFHARQAAGYLARGPPALA